MKRAAWMKLPSIVAFRKLGLGARWKFRGYQHGIWGDAAAAVQQIREARTADPRNVLVVALDGRNAYNAASRRKILETTFGDESLRRIWGISCLVLGTPGILHVFDGEQAVTMESQGG
eukprot:gene7674-biopygen4789